MRKLRQWTLNHPLQFVSVFMLVYFTWFSLLEKYAQPVLMIHSTLDDKIPFCEYFIVPYLLWFVWIAGTFVYFYIKSRDDFYHACRYMFTGMIVCLIIYTLIPNGLNLRPEITNNNIFSRLVDMIWSVDTATNVCPSIHVSSTVAVHLTICHAASVRNKKPIRTLSWIVTILICLSTMFIKQHSLVDVLCGWILSLILDEAVNVWVLVKAFSKGKAGKTTNAVHEE